MKKWGMALTALGFFCLFAMLLLTVVETCGTNAGIYRELQEANGLPEAAGISQEEMERLDGMLADYLSGDGAALDDSPFNERELAHMRDVLALFDLARTVRNVLLVAAAALLAAGLWLSRGRRLLAMCLTGLGALLVPLGAFAVWAAVDFCSTRKRTCFCACCPSSSLPTLPARLPHAPWRIWRRCRWVSLALNSGGNLYERPRGKAARRAQRHHIGL